MGMSFFVNLIAAVGASITTGAAVWIWRRLVIPRRVRRQRRAVLGFDVDDVDFAPTVIVESTAFTQTEHYRRPTVGFGAVLAVASIAPLLGNVRTRASGSGTRSGFAKVWMDTDQMAQNALVEESHHVIVVGGPLSNEKTAAYLDWLNERIRIGSARLIPSERFVPPEPTVVNNSKVDAIRFEEPSSDASKGRVLVVDGSVFGATLRSQDPDATVDESALSRISGTDYGLVIRGPAQNNSGRVIIMAGVHTIGLAAGSRFLAQLAIAETMPSGRRSRQAEREAREALDYLGESENENVLIVVKTEFSSGVADSSRLVAAWRIRFDAA